MPCLASIPIHPLHHLPTCRSRFWGTPIPIWTSEDGEEVVCVGSIAELEELTGAKVTDIHRHFIDHLTVPSRKNPGQVLRRIDDVSDGRENGGLIW